MSFDTIKVLNSGAVRRWGSCPRVGNKQTLAEHCWNMSVLLDGLYPTGELGVERIHYAIRYHDAGELDCGDLPYLFKVSNPELVATHKELEEQALNRMGIFISLSQEENYWLKMLDLFEATIHMIKTNGRDELNRADVQEQLKYVFNLADKINYKLKDQVQNLLGELMEDL
ncbi:MAG: hypothetical protein K0U41_08930 [Gammaproteobacteria bacterium]|nr:hypothetical protein [Gammaproteobacteria bacterium]